MSTAPLYSAACLPLNGGLIEQRVGEGENLADDVFESDWCCGGEALLAPPCGPTLLCDFRVARKDPTQWLDRSLAERGDPSDRFDQDSVIDAAAGEACNVHEVSPSGVGGAPLECGDDLLGQDQLDASSRTASAVVDAGSNSSPSSLLTVRTSLIIARSSSRSLARSIAARSMSRVGRRASNAANSTPPLRTNRSACAEPTNRSRRPSSA